ncbi:MAG: DUF6883 domain-containing protein [Pseudomonadota bacterium]
MRLPNAENAVVPIERLTSYLLNREHPKGKHKARLFASALGLGPNDAEALQELLLTFASLGEAEASWTDQYGQRFVIRGKMRYMDKEAMVRTVWIVRDEKAAPELLTALVE